MHSDTFPVSWGTNEDLKADVEAIKAMQEELQKRNSKFVEESPPTDKKTEETEEEGGQQEEGGTKKEKKFYV